MWGVMTNPSSDKTQEDKENNHSLFFFAMMERTKKLKINLALFEMVLNWRMTLHFNFMQILGETCRILSKKENKLMGMAG